MYLDENLNFNRHIKGKKNERYRHHQETFSRHSVVTMHKSFVRPNLDHGVTIHDQPNNESLT